MRVRGISREGIKTVSTHQKRALILYNNSVRTFLIDLLMYTYLSQECA